MYVNGKVVYITGGLVFIALMAVPALYIYLSTPAHAKLSAPAIEVSGPGGTIAATSLEAPAAQLASPDLTGARGVAGTGDAGYGAGTSANAGVPSATAPRRADGL